jgi:predicted RNase H-like nuclease
VRPIPLETGGTTTTTARSSLGSGSSWAASVDANATPWMVSPLSWSGNYDSRVLFIGIDLAWGEGTERILPRDSGLVALGESGAVIDAGWTRGLEATQTWIEHVAQGDTLLFIDAPLIVDNPHGQRLCEKQVGQRYSRWKVSANSTNLSSPVQAGVRLRQRLEAFGWHYDDGRSGPRGAGRVMSECHPYTTLVGANELGYGLERPVYKRKPKSLSAAEFRPVRAASCDDLIVRLASLRSADPPLDLLSHPETRALVDQASPPVDHAYKRREDLIDAVICAWTAALWFRFGLERCQVLGLAHGHGDSQATIIAPCRPEQRVSEAQASLAKDQGPVTGASSSVSYPAPTRGGMAGI